MHIAISPASVTAKPTAVKAVYDRLRSDIIHSLLAPGEKLAIDEMAARYRIGVNPVREALNRLSSENFVEHREQRGFYVRPASLREFRELVQARCLVDCQALEQAVANANPKWEAALVAAHAALLAAERGTGLDEAGRHWESLHCDFHRALIGAAGSAWLMRLSDELMFQAGRYRFLGDVHSESQRNTPDEHRTIMEAAIGRDAALASRLLREHFSRTLMLLEARFGNANHVVVNGIVVSAD